MTWINENLHGRVIIIVVVVIVIIYLRPLTWLGLNHKSPAAKIFQILLYNQRSRTPAYLNFSLVATEEIYESSHLNPRGDICFFLSVY